MKPVCSDMKINALASCPLLDKGVRVDALESFFRAEVKCLPEGSLLSLTVVASSLFHELATAVSSLSLHSDMIVSCHSCCSQFELRGSWEKLKQSQFQEC